MQLAPRTTKNSTRASQSNDSQQIGQVPAGYSTQTPKSSLHAVRTKLMMTHSNSQQSNLFGGLSRHVINASGGPKNGSAQGHQRKQSAGAQQFIYPKQASHGQHHMQVAHS